MRKPEFLYLVPSEEMIGPPVIDASWLQNAQKQTKPIILHIKHSITPAIIKAESKPLDTLPEDSIAIRRMQTVIKSIVMQRQVITHVFLLTLCITVSDFRTLYLKKYSISILSYL
jgi:hypothetical protein